MVKAASTANMRWTRLGNGKIVRGAVLQSSNPSVLKRTALLQDDIYNQGYDPLNMDFREKASRVFWIHFTDVSQSEYPNRISHDTAF